MPIVHAQMSPKFWLGSCQPVEKTGAYTDNFSTRACKREAGEVVKSFLEKAIPKQKQVKEWEEGKHVRDERNSIGYAGNCRTLN